MRERGETIESIAGLAGITAKQVRERLKLMGDAAPSPTAEPDRNGVASTMSTTVDTNDQVELDPRVAADQTAGVTGAAG